MGAMGRKKVVAEILSGLSVKTIERRGIDWRTCSEEALIALRGRRTTKWLESFTGYTAPWAAEIMRRAGLDWRTAHVDEIRREIDKVMGAVSARFEIIRVGEQQLTLEQYAQATGLGVHALRARRARFGSWDRVVEATSQRPGVWQPSHKRRRSGGGRPAKQYAIDGETHTLREWCELLGVNRGGVWKAAKRNKRSTAEELAARVRARRSDAAHAPASTAVASDQPPLMVSGDRVASACVASGRGANDRKAVAA